MSRLVIASLVLVCLLQPDAAPPRPIISGPACMDAATVTRVVDGDTFDVQVHLPRYHLHIDQRIRIAGIDAPEPQGITREEGLAASKWLRELLPVGSPVVIQIRAEDSFGRLVATVSSCGYDVGELAVETGHAVRWSPR